MKYPCSTPVCTLRNKRSILLLLLSVKYISEILLASCECVCLVTVFLFSLTTFGVVQIHTFLAVLAYEIKIQVSSEMSFFLSSARITKSTSCQCMLHGVSVIQSIFQAVKCYFRRF